MTADSGRILALDYGRSRIGVAVSDPSRTLATPRGVIPNRGDPEEPPDALLERIVEVEPARVVVGIPLEMDGTEGPMAREVRAFVRALAERCPIPVVEWDERLTSTQAARLLVEAEPRRGKRRQKGRLDEMAAAVLLRGYLAAGRGRGEGEEEA